MKKLITLVLAVVAFMCVGASPALASNSTCTNHNVAAQGFGGSDQIYLGGDFQCGGANNEDYSVVETPQYKSHTGAWHDALCISQVPCARAYPIQTPWWNAGTRHIWSLFQSTEHVYNLSNQNLLDPNCTGDSNRFMPWRSKVTVVFRGSSPNIVYLGTAAFDICP
jgi:hypothetical protein